MKDFLTDDEVKIKKLEDRLFELGEMFNPRSPALPSSRPIKLPLANA